MKQIYNFSDAKKILAEYIPPADSMVRSYQLDRMRELMELLGNPQDTYKVVHVAGTSGKTSTSYYIAALLGAAGAKVGLTVSPHVSEINERVQLNLVPLAETDYCRELAEFLQIINTFPVRPTYFELLIAFAYWEFARQAVDYAVVEVGLGGLLDGTNVMHRADKVCVITDIGLDHTKVLGNDLPSIAAQKAGIILPGNDVFVHTQPQEVMQVFRNVATAEQAQLHEIPGDTIAGSDLPPFQQRNWTLADAAFKHVAVRDDLPELTDTQEKSTLLTLVPARMEIVKYHDKTIILDGAHNSQKMQALVAAMQQRFEGQTIAVLIGMVSDKQEQLEATISELGSITNALLATKFELGQDIPRAALDPRIIHGIAERAGIGKIVLRDDWRIALRQLLGRPEPVLLVTGSFYLVSAVRTELAGI